MPESLQCCLQYYVILDCLIMAPDCTCKTHHTPHHNLQVVAFLWMFFEENYCVMRNFYCVYLVECMCCYQVFCYMFSVYLFCLCNCYTILALWATSGGTYGRPPGNFYIIVYSKKYLIWSSSDKAAKQIWLYIVKDTTHLTIMDQWWRFFGVCFEKNDCVMRYLYCVYLVKYYLPGQNGHNSTDDIFRCIIMNETFCILI